MRAAAMRLGREQEPQQPTIPAAERVQPPLKWAGGKRWQLHHLSPLWLPQRHRRLVEPFCGGLAIALGLRPEHALLNDVNPHLINFYRWLQEGLTIRLALRNESSYYYARRARFNTLLTSGKAASHEAASIFYYLNRTGFNGLCRFNRSGQFNVPFGRYKSIRYRRDFSAYAAAFENWKFVSEDCEALSLESTDFIYADPPYDVPFTQYSQDGFTWQDQVRTAEWLSKHRGPVVLSNQATERIVALYQRLGFRLVMLEAPRRISCTGDRAPAREVLAVRNL